MGCEEAYLDGAFTVCTHRVDKMSYFTAGGRRRYPCLPLDTYGTSGAGSRFIRSRVACFPASSTSASDIFLYEIGSGNAVTIARKNRKRHNSTPETSNLPSRWTERSESSKRKRDEVGFPVGGEACSGAC